MVPNTKLSCFLWGFVTHKGLRYKIIVSPIKQTTVDLYGLEPVVFDQSIQDSWDDHFIRTLVQGPRKVTTPKSVHKSDQGVSFDADTVLLSALFDCSIGPHKSSFVPKARDPKIVLEQITLHSFVFQG